MKLVVAHTPDPDDSFMFYGMFENKIDLHLEYEQVVKDIETLNKEAPSKRYDVTAISANGYAFVHDGYALTTSGASFGINYGPIVVSRTKIDLSRSRIAIPGKYTSSYLLYRMFGPEPKEFVETRFDEIPDKIITGEVDAGILIHDEQLTYQNKGLVRIFDIYEKWKEYAGNLPVPLGFNAIRSDLGNDIVKKFKEDFENSIKYSMNHEDDAVRYSLKYARYNDMELERKFIRMYVNELTINFGAVGRRSLDLYYDKAFQKGILKKFTLNIV